jgi:hypothetical protein
MAARSSEAERTIIKPLKMSAGMSSAELYSRNCAWIDQPFLRSRSNIGRRHCALHLKVEPIPRRTLQSANGRAQSQ